MKKGKLYLIPTSITGETLLETLNPKDLDIVSTLEHFIVETPKIARRNLSGLDLKTPIQEISFQVLDKRTHGKEVEDLLKPLEEGKNIGIMSDAGAPSIADPGWRFIQLAQRKGFEVIPMIGPSSIFLALMASGLNGQRFCFNGYLSKDNQFRKENIKQLERESQKRDMTQIFMETPYKNQHMFEDILEVCKPDTLLCIAKNVSADDGFITTLPVRLWKGKQITLDKVPTLFLIYSPKIFRNNYSNRGRRR
jgi:16S rRNA (cytidine1402-2'-O)-methyltransferase